MHKRERKSKVRKAIKLKATKLFIINNNSRNILVPYLSPFIVLDAISKSLLVYHMMTRPRAILHVMHMHTIRWTLPQLARSLHVQPRMQIRTFSFENYTIRAILDAL